MPRSTLGTWDYQEPSQQRQTHDAGALAPSEAAASGWKVCATCNTRCSPVASFCQHCGTRLPGGGGLVYDSDPAFRAERRRVTILFCDLVNSVALAAGQDPEDIADVMRQFHATLSTVMVRFGGHLAQMMGDGGLFYFGYPTAVEDDCERAVEAAIETLGTVAVMPPQLGEKLQVRIGIAAGVVVIGDLLGAPDRGGHDVVGDVPNLAARLQTAAAPGTILVSDAVHKATHALFDYEDLGNAPLRGLTTAVRLWRPLRGRAYSDRFGARLIAGTSPVVGRDAELGALAAAWEQARAGTGQVVLLIGEPGIGKSRLVHELAQTLVPPETYVSRYFCGQMQANVALHPIVEQIAHVASLTAGDPPATRLAKLTAVLPGCPDPDVTLIADLVAPGSSAGRPSVREASPERQRSRILNALVHGLLCPAAEGALLMVFEDAHWSDPTTGELLARLARAAPSEPLLLVVTARPQFQPEWASGLGVQRLELDPLAPDDAVRLVRATCREVPLPEDVIGDIVARSDGVPLFIEEVTRTMLEPGGADRGVPTSIHASLLARIDRLGPASIVAEIAATIGRAFDLALLKAVCKTPEAELANAVDRLIASGLVQRTESGGRTLYAFRHALIRDTAYGTIVRGRRRALHTQIAETLEQDFPTAAAAEPQQLALHYTAAALNAQAAAWWLRAGLQSLQRSAMAEALAQLERALSILETMPENNDRQHIELEVLVVYGKALMATQGHAADATGAVFARARALCHALGDPPQLLTVLFVQWTHSFFRVRLHEAEERATDLLDRARQRGDELWLVMGCYSLGFTQLLSGKIDGAIALLRKGIAGFDPARRHLYAGPTIGDPRVVMRTYLGWGLMMRGDFAGAERELEAAAQEARDLRQPWVLSLVLTHRIYALFTLRGQDLARPYLEEMALISVGVAYYMAVATIQRGWLLAASGDPAGGLAVAREGRSRQLATGALLHLPHFLRFEADILLQMGRVPEALESIEAGKQAQINTGEHWDDAEFHRQRGEAFLALGRVSEAETELLAAWRVSRERSQHLFGLRAGLALANLLVTQGDLGSARLVLREALAPIEHDPTVLVVAAADRLLARLDRSA